MSIEIIFGFFLQKKNVKLLMMIWKSPRKNRKSFLKH